MAKRGVPSTFNWEIADKILFHLRDGKTLTEICKIEGMPHRVTVWEWTDKFPEFGNAYAHARVTQQHIWADEIMTRSRDESRDYYYDDKGNRRSDNTGVQRDKLITDNMKWLMARLAANQYGDKITTEHTGSVEYKTTVDRPSKETPEQWQERVNKQLIEIQKKREALIQ